MTTRSKALQNFGRPPNQRGRLLSSGSPAPVVAPLALSFSDPFEGMATIDTAGLMKALSISRTLAQGMIRDGRVRSMKIGKSRRIFVDSVRTLLANGEAS
jgi:hypothetical protein